MSSILLLYVLVAVCGMWFGAPVGIAGTCMCMAITEGQDPTNYLLRNYVSVDVEK